MHTKNWYAYTVVHVTDMCLTVFFFCVCYIKSEINVNQWILVKMTKLKSNWRKYIQRLSWNEWKFRWKYIHSKSNLIHDSKLFYQIDMRYKQVSSNWTFFLFRHTFKIYLSGIFITSPMFKLSWQRLF